MRTRFLFASLSLFLMSCVPVHADGWRHEQRSHAHVENLRRACHFGDRRACFRLGQVVERRRDEWRERHGRYEREERRDFGHGRPWGGPGYGPSWRWN